MEVEERLVKASNLFLSQRVKKRRHINGIDVSIEGMRILLAEDNELNMEIAEFLLTNAGAEIIRT